MLQLKFEKLIEKNFYLGKLSREALRSFLHSYNNHYLKDVFNFRKINFHSISKCFGLKNLTEKDFKFQV